MKSLIKNLLILALLATYAFPVSAGINFLSQKAEISESEQKTMVHSCHDMSTKKETSDEDCCQEHCHLCSTCCTLLPKKVTTLNELFVENIQHSTGYLAVNLKSFVSDLIKPPIA